MWSVGVAVAVTVALHELLSATAFSDGVIALVTKVEASIITIGIARTLSLAVSSALVVGVALSSLLGRTVPAVGTVVAADVVTAMIGNLIVIARNKRVCCLLCVKVRPHAGESL